MRRFFLLSISFVFCTLLFSQTPGVQWELRGYSFMGSPYYITPDSNLIMGLSFISKLDKDGLPIWKTNLDTTDFAWYSFIKPSVDGNFLGVGITANASDIRVTKFTPNGIVLWQKDFGGSGNEVPYSVLATSDGGCIIAAETSSKDGDIIPSPNNPGATSSDCWIIKVNGAGHLDWQKNLGSSREDKAACILDNGAGGYFIACQVTGNDGDFVSATEYNIWLLNIDSNGNEIWRKQYPQMAFFSDMVRTADNNILLLANNYDGLGNHGYTDVWMAKVDVTGNIIWQKSFGGSDVENNADNKIHKTSDGNYLVLIQSYSSDGDVMKNYGGADLWMFKVDESGNLIWQKTIGESGDESGNLEIQNDGKMLLLVNTSSSTGMFAGGYNTSSGSSTYDSWLIKMDDSGNQQWKKLIEGPLDDQARVEQAVGNQIYVSGFLSYDSLGTTIEEDWLKKIGPSNLIKVRAFLDLNSDGIKEVSEHWTTDPVITATGSGRTYSSKATFTGIYYLDVDTGSYVVNISQTGYYVPLVSSQNSVFSQYFSTDSLTFALQPIPNKQDLAINIIPIIADRPGFSSIYRLFYKNVGTTTISSGEILFKKDNRTTLVSSSPIITTSNDDTLKWSYSNFAPGDTASIFITLQLATPPTVNVGDTLSYLAIITPVATDETPSNDTATLKQRVVGSFDPNDKTENNGGVVSSSFITNGDYLQYTVRFQNTGTADAINVVVRDTLGNRVDLSTLEVVAASHPYSLSIENGNQLVWTFNNIMLPPSSADEPGSHGYIVYRIRPKSDVVVGETIHNTASIYFDYNLPVLTNDATTLIQDNFSILPIQLISFTGQLNNNTVQLNWKTNNAISFKQFEIERSIDGKNFSRIQTVAFDNLISDYQAQDNISSLQSKQIFYRLKLVDADSKFSYSKVVVFNLNTTSNFIVYPNPARTELFVSLNSNKNQLLHIQIIDASGKLISEQQKEIQKGNTVFPVTTSKLKAGNYILQIISQGETKTSKFVIIN